MPEPWFAVDDVGALPSPALLVYRGQVEENLRRMIAMAGATDRLRLHVKTHKMAEVVRMQLAAGIHKFKCSTIAEAEMVARCGSVDVLLAYQPVGPNIDRFVRLVQTFPQTRFSTIADDEQVIRALASALARAGVTAEVALDVDNGLHRTGVAPGPKALAIYRLIVDLPGIEPGGLHVYDGHVRDSDLMERMRHAEDEFAPVAEFISKLKAEGLNVPKVVAGGTPTFPVHILQPDRECSPGTCVFWDYSYATKYPDLKFQYAALLLTRVVSKPGENRLCLDLGYKAVSPDNPATRVHFFDLPEAKVLVHNEEHLALETDQAARFKVGDVLYGVPFHVCPTCALHRDAIVIDEGRVSQRWPVVARDRSLGI